MTPTSVLLLESSEGMDMYEKLFRPSVLSVSFDVVLLKTPRDSFSPKVLLLHENGEKDFSAMVRLIFSSMARFVSSSTLFMSPTVPFCKNGTLFKSSSSPSGPMPPLIIVTKRGDVAPLKVS